MSLIEHEGNKFVKKLFNSPKNYITERDFYLNTNNEQLAKPTLLKYNNEQSTLYLEYIEGNTLLHELEQCELNNHKEEACQLLYKLVDYLADFNELRYIQEQQMCFNDLNLRNFLVYNNKIIAIDFEDIKQGLIISDMAKIVAMYLVYSPSFTEFKIQVTKHVKQYISQKLAISIKAIDTQITHENKIIAERRAKKGVK